MNAPWRIVIASSDSNQLGTLTEILKRYGLGPICISTVGECRDVLAKETVGLVFCDHNLADGNYRDLIKAARSLNSRARFVVTSRQADWCEFLEANRFGAFDVIIAPCRPKDIKWMMIQARRDDRKIAEELQSLSASHLARTASGA